MDNHSYPHDHFQDASIDNWLPDESLPGWPHDEPEQVCYTSPNSYQSAASNSPNDDHQHSARLNLAASGSSIPVDAEAQIQAPAELTTSRKKKSPNGSHKSTKTAPVSQRQARRERIEATHGSVGARDMPKGRIQIGANGLEWWDDNEETWRPAAPHDDYRSEMIRSDGRLGRYDFMPEGGDHEDDITTVSHAYGQQHWNLEDRSTWGNIRDDEGNKVLYLLNKPARTLEPVSLGFMMFKGLLMLDPDDHPINDWAGLPRCFSSELEGARMEALRRIYPMTIPDFRARMPRQIQSGDGRKKELFGLSTFNHRLLRFRTVYECPAWSNREGKNGLKKFTLERLVAEGSSPADPLALTTESLTVPTKLEIERRKLENSGKNPERAGGRAVSEQERKKRAAKAAKRLQSLEKQEEARTPVSARPSRGNENTQSNRHNTTSQGLSPVIDGPRKRGHDDDSDEYLVQPQEKRARRMPRRAATLGRQSTTGEQLVPSDLPTVQDLYGNLREPAIGTDLHQFNLSIPNNMDTTAPAVVSPLPSQDLRYVRPRTLNETLSIKVALLYTCLDFQQYHGKGPSAMPDDWSFAEQYHGLQRLHERNWLVRGNAPPLVSIGVWNETFNHVPAPMLTEAVAGQLLGFPYQIPADSNMDEATNIINGISTSESAAQWAAHSTETSIGQALNGAGDNNAAGPFSGLQAPGLGELPAFGENDGTNETRPYDPLLDKTDDEYLDEIFGPGAPLGDNPHAFYG